MAYRAVPRHCGGLLLCHLTDRDTPTAIPLEESIYVDASITGRGFGTALMDALIARCEQGPWRQMIAVVGDGNNNAGSLRLHKNMAL